MGEFSAFGIGGTSGTSGTSGGKPAGQIFLSAAGGWPSSTSGCQANTKMVLGTSCIDMYHLSFDKDADENAQFTLAMPSDWNVGTVSAQYHWASTGGTSGQTVKWYCQGLLYGDSDPYEGAFGTAVGVEDTLLTVGDIHKSGTSAAITLSGTSSVTGLAQFRVYRDVSEDDLSCDAALLGVMISFNRS